MWSQWTLDFWGIPCMAARHPFHSYFSVSKWELPLVRMGVRTKQPLASRKTIKILRKISHKYKQVTHGPCNDLHSCDIPARGPGQTTTALPSAWMMPSQTWTTCTAASLQVGVLRWAQAWINGTQNTGWLQWFFSNHPVYIYIQDGI